jgi:hypothetical protein
LCSSVTSCAVHDVSLFPCDITAHIAISLQTCLGI